MKRRFLRIFGVLFTLYLVILVALSAYYSIPVYVLDFGETEKQVRCQTFSFTPAENTVYCDGEPYFGVQEAGVR